MIQAGDPDSKNASDTAMLGSGDVGYTIPAEFNPKFFHKKGVLAAARQGDDVNPERLHRVASSILLPDASSPNRNCWAWRTK